MDPPVMAEVSSTKEHVDLERNSKDLTMAVGDVQGNSTIFELEMIEAQEEDAAAAAYDEIVARYRRKRADRKARIVKELGEEAYLELEAGTTAWPTTLTTWMRSTSGSGYKMKGIRRISGVAYFLATRNFLTPTYT
ncbi:uncharacterized protein LOC125522212 [Triticum urartu]|uniref:Uncharacterized protein n=1 Tax=Triticum urartu TaxID=4572 RepID=A0A8R7V0S1_TRIUA|nr:uncharacterized protein LOC125522212 [Triticum urartu]